MGCLGTVEQRYLVNPIKNAAKNGYTRFVEPCAGTFAMSNLAIQNGYKPEQIETSDVNMMSTVLGYAITGHANSPHDIISRIETMVLQGQDFPLNAIRQQIASGIDIIVQLGRLRDKSRRVLEISEVDGFMDGEIVLHTLYRFEETAVLDSGRIQGFLKKAGTLCHTDKLMAAEDI